MKVLLIGNYPADEQESMQRFSALLSSELKRLGVDVSAVHPAKIINQLDFLPVLARKWLGHIDKYALFPFSLKSRASEADIVHICDQSNSVYLNHIGATKSVVTCHDLLAVRGALGENTGCYPSPAGKVLQRWILRSLKKADMIVCDSGQSLKDVERLTGINSTHRLKLVHIGLNYKYKVLPREETSHRLAGIPALQSSIPFILNLGSSEARKNRPGVLRIFARVNENFPCRLVFAGAPLTPDLHKLAASLNISDKVLEVTKPDNRLIEALYNQAFAFLFPSLAEGFGWPVVEAQASGCPVVCSNREPLPEIAGTGALLNDIADEAGFVNAILSLKDPDTRKALIDRGIKNTERFDTTGMISRYMEIYNELLECN